MSLVLVGYYLGVLERDYQWIGQWLKAWPINREIIRWDRVVELVNGTTNASQHDGPDIFDA